MGYPGVDYILEAKTWHLGRMHAREGRVVCMTGASPAELSVYYEGQEVGKKEKRLVNRLEPNKKSFLDSL